MSLHPSKRSLRSITVNDDGTVLYAGGKGKGIHSIDTTSGTIRESRVGAHRATVSKLECLKINLFASGDDEGAVSLWDSRRKDPLTLYTHHFDQISDFLWSEKYSQLFVTSGDGSLSVIDTRFRQKGKFTHSEDQEEELTSIISFAGDSKIAVGTQSGILSIWNRKSGWGDCVDRVPGHPQSIESLCNMPPVPNVDTSRIILTGSSDGFVRVVQVLPTKLWGVLADHGDLPVEQIGIATKPSDNLSEFDNGEVTPPSRRSSYVNDIVVSETFNPDSATDYWIGSIGHDTTCHLTDVGLFFTEGSREPSTQEGPASEDNNSVKGPERSQDKANDENVRAGIKRRKKSSAEGEVAVKRRPKRDVDAQGEFFDDL